MCHKVAGLCDPNLESPAVAETPDSDPMAAVRITRLLKAAADNKPESDAYTNEMWAMLSTQRGSAIKMQLGSLGRKLDSLAFVDRKTVDGEIINRYKLYMKPDKAGDKATAGPVLQFVFAPDGKLARLDAGE
jgi:hypothetical protein